MSTFEKQVTGDGGINMREFTISPRMQRYEFDLIEEKIGDKLPNELFEFLSRYGGTSIEERLIEDSTNRLWKMEEIKRFPFIYNYLDEIKEELQIANIDNKMIPFANEETGWLFCLSVEENYPIYIFKSTNYSGKEAFQKISNSISDFLSGLHSLSTSA